MNGCDNMPTVVKGTWFSWENGRNTLTTINENNMTRRGTCVTMKEEYHTNYTFVFRDNSDSIINNNCYHCVKLIVRTLNVIEKLEGK